MDGDYVAKDTDIEANYLIKLLKLDDAGLAEKRKKYIHRKREDMRAYGQDAKTFFADLISAETCGVHFPRAIKEEFGIHLWQML